MTAATDCTTPVPSSFRALTRRDRVSIVCGNCGRKLSHVAQVGWVHR